MVDHTSLSKTEWLSLARTFYKELLVQLSDFTGKEWNTRTKYFGWSCKDLLNHMTSAITINFNLLIQLALEGNPVPQPGFNLFLRNANEVARRRSDTPLAAMQEFDKEIFTLLDRYELLTEEQWRTPAFFFIGDVDIRTLFLVQFADNLVHQRDLMIVNNRWTTFEPRYIDPLLDWFLCSFRPASFRPEKTGGRSMNVQYHIIGRPQGHWFLSIQNKTCTVHQGITNKADLTLSVTVEDLIDTALARASPATGRMARATEWLVAKEKREDYTAKITGIAAALSSLIKGKIKVDGNKKDLQTIEGWFWRFWERTEQTQDNISKSKYKLATAKP